MRLAMVIDSSRCVGCMACMVACKTANGVPTGQWRNWVKDAIPQKPTPSGAQGGPSRSHYQPGGCMHCETPTCVTACPSGATRRNEETAEVTIDRTLCIGCGNCIAACPYGARFKHEVLHVADKCDYCANRRVQGLQPACVATCPTRARAFGDISDPATEAAKRLALFPKIVRVENETTPTLPNMIYVKETAPTNWTQPAREPTSMAALTGLAQPLVKILSGLTILGVLGALFRQIVLPDKEEHKAEAPGKDAGPNQEGDREAAKKEDSHE